MAQMTSKK